MKLQYSKSVGIALAIAAVCIPLGFIMAPGWFFFAFAASWVAFVVSMGGKSNSQESTNSAIIFAEENRIQQTEMVLNPAYKTVHPANIHRETDY